MDKRRLRKLNQNDYSGGKILYWMDRDMRITDNWAVLVAQEFAKQHQTSYGIIYNLVPNYLGGGRRQLNFKIEGLKEAELVASEKNIPFLVETEEITESLPKFIEKNDIGLLITDFSPLRINRLWKEKIASEINIPMVEVDAHNIVPCWLASNKQEFAARTFRPKIHRLLPEFLTDFDNLMTQKESWSDFPKTNWEKLEKLPCDESITALDWIHGGEHQAELMLDSFIATRIKGYADKRNDPNEDNLSNLSPFFHYGNLAPQRAVLEVIKAWQKGEVTKDDKEAFIEEAVVRRELSDNFCFYNVNYDNCKGFPEWALKTLGEHAKDKREYVYSKKEFEEAETHDDLWNACQMQMVKTGKMHGYMRMYWAKKILEWTNTITYAMEVAVYLNDKYEIDGRDPNGYVGCAWSIGGLHDRAWFERPVYGKIRYMNANGASKKFDTEKYIKTWL